MIPEITESELAFIRACKPENEEDFLRKMQIYGDFLYRTNETMNLTRIPEEEFWTKHICDSLALVLRYEMPRDGRHLKMCDVGCGAGLPSLVLAAAFPGLYVTAVDSRGKKVNFVAEAAEKMGLTNLRAIHGRSNELARQGDFRHAFRLVTARAVGSAETLIRETAGLVSGNGALVLYRTPAQAEPEAEWLKAMKKPYPFELTETLELPGDHGETGTRLFLVIRGLS